MSVLLWTQWRDEDGDQAGRDQEGETSNYRTNATISDLKPRAKLPRLGGLCVNDWKGKWRQVWFEGVVYCVRMGGGEGRDSR